MTRVRSKNVPTSFEKILKLLKSALAKELRAKMLSYGKLCGVGRMQRTPATKTNQIVGRFE